jgi:hypothetical protein
MFLARAVPSCPEREQLLEALRLDRPRVALALRGVAAVVRQKPPGRPPYEVPHLVQQQERLRLPRLRREPPDPQARRLGYPARA